MSSRITSVSDADLACRDFVEVVTDYLDDTLSPQDRARFEAHVAICDGCAAYLEQLRETVRLSGSVPRAELDDAARGALRDAFRAWSRSR